jgi:two-component system response regulator AtoC
MVRKVVLVSETTEAHLQLANTLESAGLRVALHSTLASAVRLLEDNAETALSIVMDAPSISQRDLDLLAGLSLQHSRLQTMLFSVSGLQDVQTTLSKGSNIFAFSEPLSDPASLPLILEVVGPPAEPVALRPIGPGSTKDWPNSRTRAPLYAEDFLRRVGRSDVPVLLHGETGVGKEVMARRLWTYSARVGKPFLKLNCAALPSELIESELFGYEKGAFTGAMVDKPGKFELAQNGTILLDEIGDMDTRLQAKLLQVLQDGEVQPLGSSRTIKVNVRIMAATHRDLHTAIAQGTFREDLYYRLSVINITIPPLRERGDEIIPLAEQLLLRHVSPGLPPPPLPDVLRRAMLAHSWPGNVRELENVMRRFLVYQDAGMLAAELTGPSPALKTRLTVAKAPDPPLFISGDTVSFDYLAEATRAAEAKLLLDTLESVRWNRRQAALRLKIDYKAFLYKLQKHGIVESKAKRREVSA